MQHKVVILPLKAQVLNTRVGQRSEVSTAGNAAKTALSAAQRSGLLQARSTGASHGACGCAAVCKTVKCLRTTASITTKLHDAIQMHSLVFSQDAVLYHLIVPRLCAVSLP